MIDFLGSSQRGPGLADCAECVSFFLSSFLFGLFCPPLEHCQSVGLDSTIEPKVELNSWFSWILVAQVVEGRGGMEGEWRVGARLVCQGLTERVFEECHFTSVSQVQGFGDI